MNLLKYKDKEYNEVCFHNRQRLGDVITMTAGIRDFAKTYPDVTIGVCTTAMHIWDNNPYVDFLMSPGDFDMACGKGNIKESGDKLYVRIGPSSLTNHSNWLTHHMTNAYRMSIEENLHVNIKQGNCWGDLFFSQQEYDSPRIIEKPYWLICTGGEKSWGCKMYPSVKWQEVIEQNPNITFVQIGAKGDNHNKLQGENVIDYIGKTEDKNTGIRDLCKLFLNAEGSLSLVSFSMHLSGALQKPAVVIAGAREPVSFTRYPGHRYISNDGCLPCAKTTSCWACDIIACKNLVDYNGKNIKLSNNATQQQKDAVMPKCVEMIKSEEITRQLQMYYDGGRLDYNKASDKPKVNISKETKVMIPISVNKSIEPIKSISVPKEYGKFGGGALTDRDWQFISDIIDKYKVKSVLEFGAGLSTLLLNDKVGDVNITSYETEDVWIEKIQTIKKVNVIKWDGKTEIKIDKHYDLCFLDGPSGGQNREMATKLASQYADIVIQHDASREFERKWAQEYLEKSFHGPVCGGHRCALWTKVNNERCNK